MDFRRILVDDNGIVAAEVAGDDILLQVAQFGPQNVQVKMTKQEAFEIAFSLLCLVQEPDDIDVLDCLMDTNLDTEEQRDPVLGLLQNMVKNLEELED